MELRIGGKEIYYVGGFWTIASQQNWLKSNEIVCFKKMYCANHHQAGLLCLSFC